MILLSAISRGRRIPQDTFDGCVHSVFETSANLLLRGDLLITLLVASHANQPRGIRVSIPPGFRFDDAVIRGQVAACRAGIIRFAGADLSIDLRPASLWRADLTPLHLDRAQIAAAHQIVYHSLCHHPNTSNSIAGDSPLAQAARKPVAVLVEATRRRDIPAATCAAASLIGLGPGLTPSGDDYLIGFLAALRITAQDEASQHFLMELSAEITHLSTGTGDISRAFLLDAAEGQTSELIITLVNSIRDGNESSIRSSTQSLLATGSTSGPDTLAGFLAALILHSTS